MVQAKKPVTISITLSKKAAGAMYMAFEELKERHKTESIKQLTHTHSAWVARMGWHNKTVLEALALIASEVGEAVNECRGEKPTENFGEELADICLRVFDLAHTEGVDLTKCINDKIAKNEGRGTRGRRV